MSAHPVPRPEHDHDHGHGRGQHDRPAAAPHQVTYFMPFCDEALFLECTCAADGDHLGVYPVWEELVAAPIARLRQRLRARFARVSDRTFERELRQLLQHQPPKPDQSGPFTTVSPS